MSVPNLSSRELPKVTFTLQPGELSLDHTLASGQCFRWRRGRGGLWTGVVGGHVFGIRESGGEYEWWGYPKEGAEERLYDFLNLGTDLGAIVRAISAADPAAGEAAERWKGLRLLRQDPDECIMSFVCSTANSVPRIAHSIGVLGRVYGEPIATIDGQAYYAFPDAEALAMADVSELTAQTSLGFRGRNLVRVAQQLAERGPGWAESLRHVPYDKAKAELVAMAGIGAKIADCVCLFSLDKTEAVPVDTHVWQLARDLYFPEWPVRKSLTNLAYNTVTGAFRDRFGDLAGYAQNFLFYDHFSKHWGGNSPLLKDAPHNVEGLLDD